MTESFHVQLLFCIDAHHISTSSISNRPISHRTACFYPSLHKGRPQSTAAKIDTVKRIGKCPKSTETQQCYFSVRLIIKNLFQYSPTLSSLCENCLFSEFKTLALVWSTDEDLLRLSLHQTALIENMKQADTTDWELEAFCAIYFGGVFSVSVSSSHLSPAVPVGINFTSQRDDCLLPSGVCLSERPCVSVCTCVLEVATGVKQMDRLFSFLVRVHTDTHTCTACYLHIRDQVLAHSPGGWQACSECVCVSD